MTLLLAAQVGDDDAMAMLAGRYRAMIETWVRRRASDPALVDDVVSQVMWRLWRLRDRYDPERGTMAAWISVLTRTAFLDVLRERRRAPTPVADVDPDVAVDDESEQIVIAAVLHELQERLSAEHREVIRLVFVERLTMREVAERLGLQLGTVKSRCFYALRALRLHAEELGLTDR